MDIFASADPFPDAGLRCNPPRVAADQHHENVGVEDDRH
jgi:hypothetical protein